MALERLFGQLIDIARQFSADAGSSATSEATNPPVTAADSLDVDVADATLVDAAPPPHVDDSVAIDEPEPETDAPLEPIVSVPMARLLVAQGHARRALAMYEVLLARRPDDAALVREVDAIRPSATAPSKSVVADEDGLAAEDEIVAVRASDRDVLLSWQVGDERIARGKRLLPEADAMAVRIVLFHRGQGAAIRREERERIVERAGEWLVADVPRDAWMTASVGLRHGHRFVSLTHSAATRTP